LGDANGPLADAAFTLLEAFMRRVERESGLEDVAAMERFSPEEIEAIFLKNFDPESKPFTAALVANGFRLVTSEGLIFAIPDLRRFQDFFSPRVTHPMQVYLNQRTAEQRVPMISDGMVLLPLANLADLAVFWEKFNRQNPKFLRIDETQASERWLQYVVLSGTDNTPLFDPNSGQVHADFRKTWDYIQREFPDTQTAQLVKQLMDICEAAGWKQDKKIDNFLAKLQK